MSSVRFVGIIAIIAALTANSALAQRVVSRPYEPSRPAGGATGSASGGAGTSISTAPAGSLTPSFTAPSTPQLVIIEPVLALPVPAGSPPPACYPRPQSDCAAEASRCLAGEFISSNYEILWDSAGPYINRIDPAGDDAHARAADCATTLSRCLQLGC